MLRSLSGLQSRVAKHCGEALQAAARAGEGAASTSGGGAAAGTWQQLQVRWASKKQGGSTQNTKDSNPKFLGVKLYGGQRCIPGNIIVRQRGTEYHPGANVGMGRDHTIYALEAGHVKFSYDRRRKQRFISVEPQQQAATAVQLQAGAA